MSPVSLKHAGQIIDLVCASFRFLHVGILLLKSLSIDVDIRLHRLVANFFLVAPNDRHQNPVNLDELHFEPFNGGPIHVNIKLLQSFGWDRDLVSSKHVHNAWQLEHSDTFTKLLFEIDHLKLQENFDLGTVLI